MTPQPVSRAKMWTGWALSAPPVLLLLTSAINLMFIQSAAVRESFAKFGYPPHLIPTIGVLELICTLVYLIPQTSFVGAILVTAYLGGATATHVRVEDPTFIVAVVLGIMVWAGLFLRDGRLKNLLVF